MKNRRSSALVEVSAAKRRLENQRDGMAAAVTKYEQQAETAVNADRDDLARQENNLKESQVNLDRKISLFRSKKEELKAVHDSSQAQERADELEQALRGDLRRIKTLRDELATREAKLKALESGDQ